MSVTAPILRNCNACGTAVPVHVLRGRVGNRMCPGCREAWFKTHRSESNSRRVQRLREARPKVAPLHRMSKRDRVALRVLHQDDITETDGIQSPRTRGDCVGAERPCPFVRCRYNLFLDVLSSGGIRFNFPDLEADQVPPEQSCALDIADRGGGTLEDIGRLANLTRERIRQIEMKALARAARGGLLSEHAPGEKQLRRIDPKSRGGMHSNKSLFRGKRTEAEPADLAEDEQPRDEVAPLSFFAEGDSANEAITDRVWRMYLRDSVDRGFEKPSGKRRQLPVKQEEQMVGEAKPKRRGLSALVLERYREIVGRTGRAPSAREILESLGPEDPRSVDEIHAALSWLRKNGEIAPTSVLEAS